MPVLPVHTPSGKDNYVKMRKKSRPSPRVTCGLSPLFYWEVRGILFVLVLLAILAIPGTRAGTLGTEDYKVRNETAMDSRTLLGETERVVSSVEVQQAKVRLAHALQARHDALQFGPRFLQNAYSMNCDKEEGGELCDTGSRRPRSKGCDRSCKCLPGTYKDDNKKTCKQCNAGRYCPNKGATSATGSRCNAGRHCPAGSTRSEGAGACNAGRYCSAGSSTAQGSGACNAGRYCQTGSTTARGAGACTAGFYCPAGSIDRYGRTSKGGSTRLCSAGYYCPSGATQPNPCPAGKYSTKTRLSLLGDCNNVACPAGRYCLAGSSTAQGSGPCNAGRYCPAGSTTSQGAGECNKGYYCPAGSSLATQNACPAGKYGSAKALSNSACSGECNKGYYCPAGSSSAKQNACPAGKYGSAKALSNSACSGPCNAGRYCPAGSTTSQGAGECNKGYYCPAGSSLATQNACPAGKYGSAKALRNSACSGPCNAGRYCPAGSTTAQGSGACSPGHYCPAGSTTAQGSGACSPGHYCPAGTSSASQNKCPAGRFGFTQGLKDASCTHECNAGRYCLAGSALAQGNGDCQAGYFCPPGSETKSGSSECRAGYYCPAGATSELLCPAGKFCPKGSSSEAGSGPCSAGRYCPAGSTTAQGASACKPGRYCPAGSSTAGGSGSCDAGRYCPAGSATSQGARQCNPGYYCPKGATLELACPKGRFCIAGSSTQQGSGECAAGRWGGSSQSTAECQGECAAGRYGSVGQTSDQCTGPCRAAYYCPEGSSSPTGDGKCKEGHYCPMATATPIPCGSAEYYCPEGSSEPKIVDEKHYSTPETASPGQRTGQLKCQASESCLFGYRSTVSPGYYENKTGLEGDLIPCERGFYCMSGQRIDCNHETIGYYCRAVSATRSLCRGGYFCQTASLQKPCPAGSYCKEGVKKATACESGEWSPHKSTHCSLCPAGKIPNDERSGCTSCPAGFVSSSGDDSCSPCGAGTFADRNQTTCTRCAAGRWSGAEGATDDSVCIPCARGTFSGVLGVDSPSKCNACPPGKSNNVVGADASTACVECEAGFYSENEGQTACTRVAESSEMFQAEPGKAFANKCRMCEPGKKRTRACSKASDTECAKCEPGTISGSGAARCELCAAGKHANTLQTLCKACSSGRWSGAEGATDDSACIPCARGTFSGALGVDSPSKCNACPPGKSNNVVGADASTACVECEAGFYSENEGQTACTRVAESSRMFQAEPGKAFANKCRMCEPGMRISVECTRTSDTSCAACTPGTYSPEGTTCKKCDGAGEYSPNAAVYCSVATAGHIPNPLRTAQEECPFGTFSVGASDKCTTCEDGATFQPSVGQATCRSCTVCAPGKKNTRACSKALDTECIQCEPGAVSGSGAARCERCAAGKHANALQTVCSTCHAGRWSDIEGATDDSTCVPCAQGTYSGALGVDSEDGCNTCPPGKSSSIAGATISDDCIDCKPGEFARSSGQTACEPCKSGTAFQGSTFCADCDAGQELDKKAAPPTCVECKAGFISKKGGVCFACEPGKWENYRVDCSPCAPGRWGATFGLVSLACTGLCPAGKFSGLYAKTCTKCSKGRFAMNAGQETCEYCSENMMSSTDASACVAAPGFVLGRVYDREINRGGQACVASGRKERRLLQTAANHTTHVHKCPQGAVCNGGARIETLELHPGFTRPTDLSLDVRPCKDNLEAKVNQESVCIGGQSTGKLGESICRNGTAGPYCAACAKGFTRQEGECVKCSEIELSKAVAPLFILFGVGTAVAFLIFSLYRKKMERGDSDSRVIVEKVKITLSFVQVVVTLIQETNLRYPPLFFNLIEAFSFFNLDLFRVLSIGCVVRTNFYGELVATCVAPLVFAIGTLGTLGASQFWRNGETVSEAFVRMYLVVLFCVYPGISNKIFNTFKCEDLLTAVDAEECARLGFIWHRDQDVGRCYRSFLRADVSLSCDEDGHLGWQVFAGAMVFIYPLGIPLLFAWLLSRRSHADDTSLAFIRAAYKEEFYWPVARVTSRWELIEVARKLVVTFVLVFFMPGSASQLLVTVFVALAMFAVLRTYRPYKLRGDEVLAASAQILLVLLSIVVMCIKLHVTSEEDWNEGGLDFGLSMIVAAVPILALLLGLDRQLVKRLRLDAKVAVEDLAEAEAKIDKMKRALAAAQELVDKVLREEGGSLLQSYAIKHSDLAFEKEIGEGSFGSVWKGTLRGNEACAIKTMRVGKVTKSVLRSFKDEILVMAPLRHKNLVCMLGAVWDEGADKLLVAQFLGIILTKRTVIVSREMVQHASNIYTMILPI